jgi:hypothetical protein
MPTVWEWTQVVISLWTLIWVIIFAIVQTVKLTTHKNNIDHRVSNIEIDTKKQQICIEDLIDRINKSDIQFAKIEVKLTNIEALLLEMKKQIQNK